MLTPLKYVLMSLNISAIYAIVRQIYGKSLPPQERYGRCKDVKYDESPLTITQFYTVLESDDSLLLFSISITTHEHCVI